MLARLPWIPPGVALALAACGPAPTTQPPNAAAEATFEGVWTATGARTHLGLGPARQSLISHLDGTLMLTGAGRPHVGFRAQAIVLADSATGLVGRAAWTDERGDQLFSELRGEGTTQSNRIVAKFLGGTGRYAGVQGGYEFSWQFLLEDEQGRVQGQSTGLKGHARIGKP